MLFANTKVKVVLWLLLAIYAFNVVITAWMCDDAFITYGVAQMFWRGHGLVYNIGDRVQSYTNPLMLFCMVIIGGITGEGYFSTLLINIATSLLAFWLVAFKLCQKDENGDPAHSAVIAPLMLIFSKTYILLSTSGLENSLEHLLLAIFCWQLFNVKMWSKKRLYLLCFTACMLAFCRYDIAILVLPALCYVFFCKAPKDGTKLGKSALIGTLGILPFVAWEVFCLIYYGFLFPNTAYAKLGGGIPKIEYFFSGIGYIFASFMDDIVGIAAIGYVLIIAVIMSTRARRMWRTVSLATGCLFYLLYVICVGGDFMTGRLLSPLVFVSAVILGRLEVSKVSLAPVVLVFALVCGIVPNAQYIYKIISESLKINVYVEADEYAFYSPKTGLLRNFGEWYKGHGFYQWYLQNKYDVVFVTSASGMPRIAAGDRPHIVDRFALTDALLARLPAKKTTNWRSSHLERAIPSGYLETISIGKNVIEDKNLADYYDKVHTITSTPIFSKQRFETIVNMNLGKYDYLVDKAPYRYRY